MAKSSSKRRNDKREERAPGPRPFWSGVIAFGLVNLAVGLYPANRGKSSALKMVDQQGNRLRRRYFCPQEEKILTADDLVRGYEVEKNTFVTVQDEELEALAPKKSREINLSRFVPLEQLEPLYFQAGYFLAPDPDAIKAYRLLADTMEENRRAGVATFVLRGKEKLVAIIAEAGILRAETLRFHDELRSPESVGLPKAEKADAKLVKLMARSIKNLSDDSLNRELLADEENQRLVNYVEEKIAKRKDIVHAPEADDDYEEAADNVIDLMEVLKARLQGEAPPKPKGSKTSGGGGKNAASALKTMSREELYEKAKELDIPGRSKMSKTELARAVAEQ